MTQQITIQMTKRYDVKIDQYIPHTVSSVPKLIEYLNGCEFNTLSVTFETYKDITGAQRKTYERRLNKLATELSMTVAFIENAEIDGYVFPDKFVAALI